MSGSSPATATLSVTGAVTTPTALTDATLASNYTAVTVTIGGVTYTGASVYSLISAAGFTYPTTAKNGALLDYLQVSGTSGQVVLSEGEVDPSFGGATSTDIIAYAANGAAIAPELIVPGDVNGGIGGRDVTGVQNIQVATATVPASATTSATIPPLQISGAVATPAVPLSATQVETLGITPQTDTFLQGTTPQTYTFTGAPLLNVLTNAGLSSDIADSYIVAAGSDGYGVVYSGGEIDPAYRAGATALVAYDDGTGTFPSVGGVSGALRSTAPSDSKGGRYVSSLDSLSVANGVPSASIANYVPNLSAYNAATSLALNGVITSLAPSAASIYGSLSPYGSSFAPAVPGAATVNVAVVTAPSNASPVFLQSGYEAAFLQGATRATLADSTVGHALLAGNQGADFLAALMGSDTVVAGGGADTLFGSAAGDVLVGYAGTNTMVLGAGAETAETKTSSNLIFLGAGSSTVLSNAADTIVGGGGASTVFAGQADSVFGGSGRMLVVNGGTASTVFGGTGTNTVYAGVGGGIAYAGLGGGSLLTAGTGAATLTGAATGDQLLAGGASSDLLIAGAGNETLSGVGSTGADVYFGGTGNDVIFTGAGASTVAAGTGSSTVVAGSGADVFSFVKGFAGGTMTVFGFQAGVDVISLVAFPATEPAADLAASTQAGGSTTLALSDGTKIVLAGVTGLTSSSVV